MCAWQPSAGHFSAGSFSPENLRFAATSVCKAKGLAKAARSRSTRVIGHTLQHLTLIRLTRSIAGIINVRDVVEGDQASYCGFEPGVGVAGHARGETGIDG